ncbi:putative metal dependent phosphohydrolase [Alkaliphilus metalliredigens QYMF]|uniref:Putative metal dependent phosphohydrolase n=1 Tax=Alkaliphilus metalliredigens (strain QYMF) TaxID=293826 RepID=A6TVP0_ALKMQ|nr:HD domain-containing phosphohydrolase [Alkaliphilus metalliredigens]ABR50258.1 putative metal dependent phosphohydrolase [Alkaliphilus metalliredigens QYMF]
MIHTERVQESTIFIKKQVKDLVSGDIILHPIYRSDGLMLMKQYKTLVTSLVIKIKHQITRDLPVIVLSSHYNIETFNEMKLYNNSSLIVELETMSKKYSDYMQVPLEKNILVDKRVIIETDTEPVSQINYNENYIDLLCDSPFFSTFEEKLESSHLQLRAKKVKKSLIDIISDNKVLLSKLNEIKDYKDILLLHSINTTGIALMIGLTLELTESNLIDLALANLLIDISVTQIPKKQFELHLKHNTSNSDFYNLHLNELKKLSEKLPLIRKESIIYGVLDHYEHYSGKGYPKGKKESTISIFGRIIPIAQAYDETIGGYFYNDGIRPIQALQTIWEGRGTKFDPNILRIFIDRTTLLKKDRPIILSNHYRGIIMGFTDFINFPLSPIVKLDDGSIVDLLDMKNKEYSS